MKEGAGEREWKQIMDIDKALDKMGILGIGKIRLEVLGHEGREGIKFEPEITG